MHLTEKDVQQRLKHTRAKTTEEGNRRLIYYPGIFPLLNPHRHVRVIVADGKTWQEVYDMVKDRNDLGRAKSVTFEPANARYKTTECHDAYRLVNYLTVYEDMEAEVLEHKDVYYVVPKIEPDLFTKIEQAGSGGYDDSVQA